MNAILVAEIERRGEACPEQKTTVGLQPITDVTEHEIAKRVVGHFLIVIGITKVWWPTNIAWRRSNSGQHMTFLVIIAQTGSHAQF